MSPFGPARPPSSHRFPGDNVNCESRGVHARAGSIHLMRSEVAKARRSQLDFARVIEADLVSGLTVDDMVSAAARDRCALALDLCAAADVLIRSADRSGNVATARSAVSRGYYSMFQAARAVVFIAHRGRQERSPRTSESTSRRLPKSGTLAERTQSSSPATQRLRLRSVPEQQVLIGWPRQGLFGARPVTSSMSPRATSARRVRSDVVVPTRRPGARTAFA